MTYAGLGMRLRAFLWDYLLILLYVLLLVLLGWSVSPVQEIFGRPALRNAAAFVLLVLPVMLYFALAEGRGQGATWGKRRLGLRVVRADGHPLGLGRSLVRSALKFLPWQLAHTAIFQSLDANAATSPVVWLLYALAYGLAIFYLLVIRRGADHRAPYDRIAGSAVVDA